MSCFLRYRHNKKTEVELELPNYATKYSLKTGHLLTHGNLLERLI